MKVNAFMKYEVLRNFVIRDNTYAEALSKISDEHELIIDQFMYLSQTVQHVGESFGKLARFRGRQRESA